MAAWADEGIAISVGFGSDPDASPWEWGWDSIDIPIGYASDNTDGTYKMQGISLDVDYDSVNGESNFSLVFTARRATLVTGNTLIMTGTFSNDALRATLSTEAEVSPDVEHGDIVAEVPMSSGDIHGYLHNRATIISEVPMSLVDMHGLIENRADISAEAPMSSASLDAGARIEAESPMSSGELVGSTYHKVDIEAICPCPEVYISGTIPIIGDIAGAAPMSTPDIHGAFTNTGDIEATAPHAEGYLSGLLHNRADIEAESPMPSVSMSGLITISASISVISPMSYPGIIVTQESLEEFLALVLNTENNALSEYDNFDFNSLTEFNGKFIGCKSDGIYSLEGDDDEGVDIDAEIAWPIYDFAEDIPKLPREAWIMGRKDGTLVLTVTSDEGDEEYPYPTAMKDSLMSEERVEFGRGLRGRFFNFTLTNEQGAFFDFNNIRILAEQSVERKRRR